MMSSSRTPALLLHLLLVLSPGLSTHAQTPLIKHGETWRYRKGLRAPQADWKTTAGVNLDDSWASGPGGFGYADDSMEVSRCDTILDDMRGRYSTVAMRKSFQITEPLNPALRLVLTMDWDDGFIAWLDGVYLASANSPGAPNEPAFDAIATASHESSRGNSSPSPAAVYDLGPVGERLAPGTHILAIIGLNTSLSASSDFVQVADLSLFDPLPTNCVSGRLDLDATWSAANSPILVCSDTLIPAGVTLTIEPGVTVQFAQGAAITVADGGRLIGRGTPTNHIRFTRAPNAIVWAGITVNGSPDSPESRLAYCDFDSNARTAIQVSGGTVLLEHLNFFSTDEPYLSLDGASFVVSDCLFPAGALRFEPVHGTGGIKSGGYGIFRRNFFGGTIGYSDIVDFTGGNRPGPIVHFMNNVFIGSEDDAIDLDGTDAWIEGNIFLKIHRNGGTPDTSAAISGGDFGLNTSEITIIGNLFFDCDNGVTAKQGNFFTVINNTFVRMTRTGGVDFAAGAVNVRDTTPSLTRFASGVYFEGNIVRQAEQLVRNYDPAETTVTLNQNILSDPWTGPGIGNAVIDPLLVHLPDLSEISFASWEEAQLVREWFELQPGSPAIATGPNGRDKGGRIPLGVSISGEPPATTPRTDATLIVGINRDGFGIPVSGWPEGAGYTHYRWRLDSGTWSGETNIHTPITLTGLPDGPHQVEVIGKRDSGLYQNDPLFGDDAIISTSRVWTVQTLLRPVIDSVSRTPTATTITFVAEAGRSYSVLARDALDLAHPWSKFQDVPAPVARSPVSVVDTTSANARFYLIVTPALER